MEQSEELRQVVIRFFEALRDGDEEAVRNRISRQPGFERMGTDADEVWHDGEAAARLWVQQLGELGGGYPWQMTDLDYAMVEGTVGWGRDRRLRARSRVGRADRRIPVRGPSRGRAEGS